MDKITINDAAKILGVKPARATKRLRALGYATSCRRCVRGYVSNGIGGNLCWTCGGTGKVIEITESQAHEAVARIAAGDLTGYFAQNEAKARGETDLDAGEVGRIVVDLFAAISKVATRTAEIARYAGRASAIRAWNEIPRAERGEIVRHPDGTFGVTRKIIAA